MTKYVDENGNVVAAYEYDDFGKAIAQTGPMAEIFRVRFSTKYYAPGTGLYYYGYRFYAPALMRWLNRDPIEEDGGLNLYGFCGNITRTTRQETLAGAAISQHQSPSERLFLAEDR